MMIHTLARSGPTWHDTLAPRLALANGHPTSHKAFTPDPNPIARSVPPIIPFMGLTVVAL
jgi:hypothetical protein